MPVQPDHTHPKFLEGDDVLMPPTETENDVQGHLDAVAVPVDTGPDHLDAAAVPDEGEDQGTFRSMPGAPNSTGGAGLTTNRFGSRPGYAATEKTPANWDG